MSDPPPTRAPWPALLAMMAIGLVARLINSGSGLWFDEVVTLVKYVRAPLGDLLTSCTDFNNHMLFTLLAKASVGALGEAAWTLRLPAILFGVAAIPALWWFASRIVDGREALLAAVLLAVTYQPVWYSQNARGYTGLMFFGLIATGLFVEGMRRPALRTWVAYGLVSAAAVWTHLTAGFAIAAHGIVWLGVVAKGRIGREAGAAAPAGGARPLAGFVIAGLLGLALYAAILPQMAAEFGKQAGVDSVNVKVRAWTSPWWTIQEAVRQSGLGSMGVAAFALAALLSCAGFVSLARRQPLAVLVMVLPAPVALLVLKAAGFHIWPRYFFPLFGFALVFLVHGIRVIADRLAGRAGLKVATAAVVLVALASLVTLVPNWKLPKQDYERARKFVVATAEPGDAVVTAGLASFPYARLYAPAWTAVERVEDLDRVLATAPRTWLVYSFPTVLATSHPEILERARSRFEVVREFPGTVGDGTVYVARTR